jgi:hypothetical protein
VICLEWHIPLHLPLSGGRGIVVHEAVGGVLRRDAESVPSAHEVEVPSVASSVATHFLHPEPCAHRDAKSVSAAHEVEGVLRREARSVVLARDAKSVSVAHGVEGVLPRDAKSVSVVCDAKSASAAHEVESALRRDAQRVSVALEVGGVLRAEPHAARHEAEGGAPSVDSTRVPSLASLVATHFLHPDESCPRRDAKRVSVAHEVEGVLRRDAVSVSVDRKVEGVLPRDAKSVSVVHEVEGELPRDAMSVSFACEAMSASAAREIEGVLRRDAKSASVAHEVEGVLPRDAKSVSVARGAKSASAAHELEGVLRRDAKGVSVAHEVEGVSRAEPHAALYEAEGEAPSVGTTRVPAAGVVGTHLLHPDKPCARDAESVSVAHEVEGVLRRDAKSVSVARDAKSVSVSHEVEGVDAEERCTMCGLMMFLGVYLEEGLCACELSGVVDPVSSATADLCSAGACDTIHFTTLAAFPRRPMKKYKFLLPGTLDTCRHDECGELRRQLTANKKLTCTVCAFDHAQRVCSFVYCDAPIVFVRGWHGGWEFKVLGDFVHDPPDASRGEALRCVPCHSSLVGPGNLA